MLAKLTYKNQLTLPKAVVKAFAGTEYFDVVQQRNAIILRPVDLKPIGVKLEKIRAKIRALGVTEADLNDAIRWARRKRE